MSRTTTRARDAFTEYVEGGMQDVEGWLEPGAIPMLRALEDEQRVAGVQGAIGEIGVHHGRLFVAMALLARPGEALLALDLFEDQHLNRDWSGAGERQAFRASVRAHLPEDAPVMEVRADSTEISGADLVAVVGGPLRLFSVDGGHTEEVVLHDLETADAAIAEGGIVLMDDFQNPLFPGAAVGASRFLVEHPARRLVPFATGGNKLWLTTRGHAERYRRRLIEEPVGSVVSSRMHAMVGDPVYCVSFGDPAIDAGRMTWEVVEQLVERQCEALGIGRERFLALAVRAMSPEYVARLAALRRGARVQEAR
jgi:hypothetical protein